MEHAMSKGKWISELSADTPLEAAARRVLIIRLEVVRDWLGPALRDADKDPEHIHQLRVATRRAAAALDIFGDCLPKRTRRTMKRRLGEIRGAAGEVRDWDVLILELVKRAKTIADEQRPGVDYLFGYAMASRGPGLERLRSLCPEYPFAFEKLMAGAVAAVRRPPTGGEKLGSLARHAVQAQLEQLNTGLRQDLNDYHLLHDVRLVGKRLRYAAEVFIDCFRAEFRQKVYPAIEKMQGILGDINDAYVAVSRLGSLRSRVMNLPDGMAERLLPFIDAWASERKEQIPRLRRRFTAWHAKWSRLSEEYPAEQVLQPVIPTEPRCTGPMVDGPTGSVATGLGHDEPSPALASNGKPATASLAEAQDLAEAARTVDPGVTKHAFATDLTTADVIALRGLVPVRNGSAAPRAQAG